MNRRAKSADATHPYQKGDFIALEMGRLAAWRVTPESLQDFKKYLEKTHERNGDSKYLRMWFEIVQRGPDAVKEAFTETSERGQVLRSTISFRAFVAKTERDKIFHERTKGGAGN